MAKVWKDMGGGVQELQDDASSYKTGYAPTDALANSGVTDQKAVDAYYAQPREKLNNTGGWNLSPQQAANYNNGGAPTGTTDGFAGVQNTKPGIISQAQAPAPSPVPAPVTAPAAGPSPAPSPFVTGATPAPGAASVSGAAPAPGAIPAPAPSTAINWSSPDKQAAIKSAFADPNNDPAKISAAMEEWGVPKDAVMAAMGWDQNQFNSYFGVGAPGTSSTGIISSSRAAQLGAPTTWNVTPEQTVEGRINSIVNPNSPIIQQARARALQTANERGLANSSMAITAGDAAAYDVAIPIAQADAATYAKAAGWNADQANQFAVRNVDSENQFRLAAVNNEAQRGIAELNASTQKSIASMNIEAQKQANQLANENKTLLDTNAQASQAFNTAASAVSAIQNNTNMDAATKTQAIANIWHDVQQQFKVMSALTGLNLSTQLNFAGYPGFDAQGNWVGFGGAPAPSPAPVPATTNGGSGYAP